MKTYKQLFCELDRAALIPFFVIGDPDFDTSLEIVKKAIDAGAERLNPFELFSGKIAIPTQPAYKNLGIGDHFRDPVPIGTVHEFDAGKLAL